MSAPTPAEGTIIGEAYRIVRPLSAGGMGAVYVAEQLSTGKLRALKLMHHRLQAEPKLRERFVKEARVAASIESAHVVEVIGAGVEADTGTPWLAMELLDGEDLGAHLARCGARSPSQTLELLEQIGHALGEAHDAGIVHRDLKPENVFIAKTKAAGQATTVKILDFGIAKLVADAQTMGTAAVGSPAWMAPEQAESSVSITPATDVWALGLLVFWMLTGSSYWRTAERPNSSMHAFLKEVLFEALPTASKRAAEVGSADRLPRGFDEWFDRSVHREPRARFRSARELLEAFRSLVEGAPLAEQATGDGSGAAAETVPMSTRAFLSSGGIDPVDLSDEPPDEPDEPDEQPHEEHAPVEPGRASGDESPAEPPQSAAAADDAQPSESPAETAVEPVAQTQVSAAPAGPDPSTVAAATALPRDAATESAPPQASARSRLWLLGLAAALGVAAMLAWFTLGPRDPDGDDLAAADPTATAVGGAAPDSTGEAADTAAGAGGTASEGGSGPVSSVGGGAAASTPSRPGRPSAATASSVAPSATADAGPVHPPFNRFTAEHRVKQRASFAGRQCASRDGPRAIPVTLVFGGDGRVKQLSVPRAMRHKSSGVCVTNSMRHIVIGPFSGPDQTLNVTVSLP